MNMINWQPLVEQAKGGNLDAFEQLVRHFQDMAVAYAYSVLGDFDLAEDAAQEAFIRVYRHLPSMEKPAAFPAWFRKVVRSCCYRMTRGKQVSTVPLYDVQSYAASHPDPSAIAQRRELQDKVLQAILALPDEQREVTTLFYINGYSMSEVGEFLDMPVPKVKNRLYSARNQLRERMSEMVERTLKQHAAKEGFSEEVRRKIPYQEIIYDDSRVPKRLTNWQRELVLSTCPSGSEILDEEWISSLYGHPRHVRVRMQGGAVSVVDLLVSRFKLWVETEARILPVLSDLGVPVQTMLTEPMIDPEFPEAGPMAIATHISGDFPPFINPTADEIDVSCRLIMEGALRLQSLTDKIRKHPVAEYLPERTLLSELEIVIGKGGPWMKEKVFTDAIDRVRPVLKKIKTPLVFSNGLNHMFCFLHNGFQNGHQLSGFLQFGFACFEDPHVQFTRYKYWGGDKFGWGIFNEGGLVERWLYRHNVSRVEFAPRLVVRCLWLLQREVSAEPTPHDGMRDYVLKVLNDALKDLPKSA